MVRGMAGIVVRGVVYRVGQQYCSDVASEAGVLLGGGLRVAIRAQIGAAIAQTSLVRRRDGDYRLYLPTELRRPTGLQAGHEVEIRLTLDATEGEPVLPDDLLAALRVIDGGLERLAARSPADRRQLCRWLASARGAATRAGRIEQAIERILGPRPGRGRGAGPIGASEALPEPRLRAAQCVRGVRGPALRSPDGSDRAVRR